MVNQRPGGDVRAIIAAWILALTAPGVLYASLWLTWTGTPAEDLVPGFVAGGVGCLVAMAVAFWLIRARSGAAGDHTFFKTWFPLMLVPVPLAGPLVALWFAFELLVQDKLRASTITTDDGASRSTVHHDEVPLNGVGRPAGILLLSLVGLQPMLYLIVTSAEEKNAEASPAMVEHAPAPAVAEKYRFDPPRVWEQEACDGVITCYQAADVVGLVAGRVTMELDSEGGVERVELRIPDTTDAIRNCVRQVAQGKQLPDYNGLPATLRCDFAGVVSGEATSVERVGHYTPHTEE